MGSSAASAECLHALLREEILDIVGVVTQPDRPVGRGKVLTPCPLARYAAERGLGDRIIKPENVNADEPMAAIRAWRPDVVAVVAYGQLLKKPLLDLPLFGCVNCHFSLLPKYRGAAPVVAALAAGERLTGVTVMHMGVGLDDGPIMLQSFEPIYPDTTGGALMSDLATAGGVTLAKALRLMSDNALPPEVPQDSHFATYAKKLKLQPGQTLHFELGRAVVAQCGSLITRTLYIKKGAVKKFAIVDAGFTDLIRPALYQAYHKIENISSDEPMEAYDVVGPICESTDVFAKQIDLNKAKRGDLLAIRSAGAYGEIMASQYNLRKLPKGYMSDEI